MLIDRALGGGALLLAGVVAGVSWRYGIGTTRLPGAGFWPLLIAASMAGLGIALVARPAAAGSPSTDCPSRWRSFAIGMGTLVFYVLALEPLGYLAATFGLLLVQCRWVEGRSWRGSLLIAVAAAVISLLVFRALLKVPLPLGILPPPPW